jgi:hypothetical protein
VETEFLAQDRWPSVKCSFCHVAIRQHSFMWHNSPFVSTNLSMSCILKWSISIFPLNSWIYIKTNRIVLMESNHLLACYSLESKCPSGAHVSLAWCYWEMVETKRWCLVGVPTQGLYPWIGYWDLGLPFSSLFFTFWSWDEWICCAFHASALVCYPSLPNQKTDWS